jgi:hypothetical protein
MLRRLISRADSFDIAQVCTERSEGMNLPSLFIPTDFPKGAGKQTSRNGAGAFTDS